MITIKEITTILFVIIILAFVNSFSNLGKYLESLILFAIILFVYVTAKKITAYYYEAEEETKIWTFQRYGWLDKDMLRNPFPIGIVLPFILTILTLGSFKWMASTETEVRPLEERAVRKHEYFSFYEMSDWNLALIVASGIFFVLILSIVGYIFDYSELSRLAIYFAFFNMLPIGKLDGTKIFFGSPILYIILGAFTIIGLAYALLLI